MLWGLLHHVACRLLVTGFFQFLPFRLWTNGTTAPSLLPSFPPSLPTTSHHLPSPPSPSFTPLFTSLRPILFLRAYSFTPCMSHPHLHLHLHTQARVNARNVKRAESHHDRTGKFNESLSPDGNVSGGGRAANAANTANAANVANATSTPKAAKRSSTSAFSSARSRKDLFATGRRSMGGGGGGGGGGRA